MRTKVTLVLVFLNVALFFYIFKFERIANLDGRAQEARRRVLGPEAADIRALEVTSTAPGGSFSLVRRREAWFLTAPLDWPANPNAATGIVTDLMLLEHETSFSVAKLAKSKQSLADYGLDKPKITVAFASGDAAATGGRPLTQLRIGDTSKDGKRLYVLSPDGETIHIVNRSLLDRLSVPLEQLRADTLLSVRVYEARSLAVQNTSTDATGAGGKGASLRVRIQRDANGNRWTFVAPFTALASRTHVELAINQLDALHAKSFPSTPPPTLPSASYTVRVQIEGTNRGETLFIGERVNAAPAPGAVRPTTGGNEYYGQLEGRNAVFTVEIPRDLMTTLLNAQVELREKRFLDFDPRAVTEVVLAAPAQPNQPPLTLQRLDPSAGQPRDAAPRWQIVRRGESTSGPQTLAAEAPAVQRLLDRLSLLEAKTFQSDAPTSADLEEWGFNRPLREITMTLATPGGAGTPLMLRIGTDVSRRNTYARIGTPADPGAAIYAIDSSVIDDLPLSPAAWRNRAVIEPLPESARITALKLTDILENRPLVEVAMNAAGDLVSTTPRDPKAVREVVAALRNLRAKEFLPGGYVERVFAAGDERPWRFQLEATVSLPGGAGVVQTSTLTLLLTERLGGGLQFAGSKEIDAVFALEQPFVDALWALAYAARDPGSPPEKKQ